MNNPEFITAIREHKPLGYVVAVYHAEKADGNFLQISENLNSNIIEKSEREFSETEKKIIKLADSYSDKKLKSMFNPGQKSSAFDYIQKLDPQHIEKRIRPFIEKQITKIFELLLQDGNIRVFKKTEGSDNLHPQDEIQLNRMAAKTVFNIIKTEEGTKYFLSVKHNERRMNLSEIPYAILSEKPCMLLLDKDFFKFEDIDAKKLLPFFSKKHILVPKSAEHIWYPKFAANAVKNYDVNLEGITVEEILSKKKRP